MILSHPLIFLPTQARGTETELSDENRSLVEQLQRAREDRERVLREADAAEITACQRARDEGRAEANEARASEMDALRRAAT